MTTPHPVTALFEGLNMGSHQYQTGAFRSGSWGFCQLPFSQVRGTLSRIERMFAWAYSRM